MSALCWARHTSVTDLLCSALSARCQASKYERSPSDESDLKCTLAAGTRRNASQSLAVGFDSTSMSSDAAAQG